MDLLNWVSLCHQGTVRRGGSARRRTPGCKSQAATSPVPRPANSTSLNSSSSILPGPYNSWPCRSSQAARSVSSHEKLTLSKNLELRTYTFTSAVKSSYSPSSATAKQLWVCVYVYAGGRRQRRSAFLKLPALPTTGACLPQHCSHMHAGISWNRTLDFHMLQESCCWLQHLFPLNFTLLYFSPYCLYPPILILPNQPYYLCQLCIRIISPWCQIPSNS